MKNSGNKFGIFSPKKNGFKNLNNNHNNYIRELGKNTQNLNPFVMSWNEKQLIYLSACHYKNFHLNRYPDVLACEENRVILNSCPYSKNNRSINFSGTIDISPTSSPNLGIVIN